ncbi:sugar O-acetyltransferase [Novisyntrophococcus fermenticellae]|uniref:sugar O-acetyltransferase n=1 Tax=Novisyntrophococcus fermenticellae TaxID=2068655 RepID=UPI001E2A3E4E|nr:sugar O-acetyltransferase [Novisyntrophococcus fermenticellae]
MTNKERKEKGLVYRYDDLSLLGNQFLFQEKLYEYNHTRPTETEKRQQLLKEIFAEIGEDCHVEIPLNANWGCKHVHFGKGIYCNSNVTFVDDADIYVGDNCLIAPNVVISTSGHPILPVLREHHYVYNLCVYIGKNTWIGSGVQIMPGVTIGDNSVIGAGSVVTNDIPSNVVALGIPCRVVREIGEKDRKYYFKNRELDVWE